MTELELLVELHKNTYRQGPGSDTETLKALALTGLQSKMGLKVADIGCGTGAPTLALAKALDANITAVDFIPEFIGKLNERSTESRLENKIVPLVASMDDLPFAQNEFDLIWSEGAIYNMGFENGLRYWKPFLKENGYIAVSDISWITHSRPIEIQQYWDNAYPGVKTVSEHIAVIEALGYSPVGHFVLPENCWTENYYKPLSVSARLLQQKYGELKTAVDIINGEKEESRIYTKFKDYYSYGFYIAKILF